MKSKTVQIVGADFTETWQAYDHPDGFWVHGAPTSSITGEIHPLLGHKFFLKDRIEGVLQPIRDSIPDKIHQLISEFDHYLVELTALASLNEPAFLRLHRTNPMLLVLVARSVARHCLWRPDHWATILGMKWRDIAEAIGCHPSVAGAAAKIRDRRLMAYGYIQLFLTAASKPGLIRLLRHVEEITLDVLTVALSLPEEAMQCPALLHSAGENKSMVPIVTEDAVAIRQVRERMGLEPAWPYNWVPQREVLSYWRARLEETAMKDCIRVDTVYPAPPISPDSQWTCITTADELTDFAEKWKNCGKSLHWRLLLGITMIWHQRNFSPTALCAVIDKEPNGWRVSSVLMPDNQPPSIEMVELVRMDFEDALNG